VYQPTLRDPSLFPAHRLENPLKIRLTGTRDECDRFTAELLAATPPGVIREVSGFYPNRGASTLGRIYLDLHLPGADASPATRPDTAAGAGHRRDRRSLR
jgi:hypothetical protein